jgi:hypothetical protein
MNAQDTTPKPEKAEKLRKGHKAQDIAPTIKYTKKMLKMIAKLEVRRKRWVGGRVFCCCLLLLRWCGGVD